MIEPRNLSDMLCARPRVPRSDLRVWNFGVTVTAVASFDGYETVAGSDGCATVAGSDGYEMVAGSDSHETVSGSDGYEMVAGSAGYGTVSGSDGYETGFRL